MSSGYFRKCPNRHSRFMSATFSQAAKWADLMGKRPDLWAVLGSLGQPLFILVFLFCPFCP